ncbi:hypothetical protein FGADI_7668 [Fusarium gaditjirri]|uniref:Uncharacterized protein n=1 Tax=Fusarium gaditjirri TaxID=282569 RepID=A0A8H4T4K1_9HYPO|nr:hypothetical protein FGADI_7668 [Fusarium gaditjirri]
MRCWSPSAARSVNLKMAKIPSKPAQELFLDKDIAVLVVECLVLGMLIGGGSSNTHISDAESVGGVIDALVEEELVTMPMGIKKFLYFAYLRIMFPIQNKLVYRAYKRPCTALPKESGQYQ